LGGGEFVLPAINIDVVVRDSGLLDRLEETSTVSIPREMGDAIEEILQASIEQARTYPPETSGNQPPPPYYERGVGNIGRGGFVTKVSEDMQGLWSMQVTRTDNTVTGQLRNLASYAKYVHNEPSDPEPPYQAWFHAQHGWKTIQAIVREQSGGATTEAGVVQKIQQAVDKIASIFRR